jgi:FkbM family methyltransferase
MPSDVGEWTNNINANKGHGVGKDSGFRRSRPALRELSANSAQVLLMPLSLRERLTMLTPPSVFYRQRIAQEARTGEPELAVLAELVPRGGIAVDVGANVGFFAYALADIADRVVAFEPNPDYAFFARWMLRGRAEVREVALSDASGRGTLYVPLSDQGVLLHLAGSLKRSHVQFRNIKTYDVEIRTLDEAGLVGVRFVKADVEGCEREVLDGARATIARDRPIIMLELLSGTHENPAANVAAICESFGYEAFIVQRGEKIAALPAISALGKNTSWGSEIESRNVLFSPQ